MSTFYFYNEYAINALFQKQGLNVEFGTVVAIATVLFFLSRQTRSSLSQHPGPGCPRDSVHGGRPPSVSEVFDSACTEQGTVKASIVIIPERSSGVLVIPAIPWGIGGPEKACDLPERALQHPGNATDQHRTVGSESTFRCKFSLYHWENWGQKEYSCPRSHSELGRSMASRSWALLSSHRLLDNCLSWVLVKFVFCLLITTQSDVFWATVHGVVSILVCLVFMAPWWYGGKEPAWGRRLKRHGFDPWVGKSPLEKEMAAHCNILAWEIPWTEEPGGL